MGGLGRLLVVLGGGGVSLLVGMLLGDELDLGLVA